LRDFLASDGFCKDLNEDNPFGSKGEVARALRLLVERIWHPNYESRVSPENLHDAVGHFAPKFAGYYQQDAHKLLVSVLNALQADLNRIRVRPPTAEPCDDAEEAWRRYRKGDDSCIVDLFSGQLRNSLTCPKCGRVACGFDPFQCLSLPLIAPEGKNMIVIRYAGVRRLFSSMRSRKSGVELMV
jgi:ubiquitin C-terminal hydrolase